jgi:hypothetical protein
MQQMRDKTSLKRRNRLVMATVVTIMGLLFAVGLSLIILK